LSSTTVAQYPWSLTLVIPALNEERVLENVVDQVFAEVLPRVRRYEVILINDGSTDRTGAIMDRIAQARPGVRVLHNSANFGLGASYQRGVREARYDYIMLLCGDGGFPAASLPAVFEKIGQADIVVPYMTNLRQIKTTTRYLLSRAYTGLLNLLFGFRLKYYNGLPVHRTALVRRIDIVSDGFGFQGEVLVKLLKSGCSFVEVGVNGAEETKRSFALRPKNIASVAYTFAHLVAEVLFFKPIPADVVEDARRGSDPEPQHGSLGGPAQ
jgi:dolichol-phosphate mannosyltransferase